MQRREFIQQVAGVASAALIPFQLSDDSIDLKINADIEYIDSAIFLSVELFHGKERITVVRKKIGYHRITGSKFEMHFDENAIDWAADRLTEKARAFQRSRVA